MSDADPGPIFSSLSSDKDMEELVREFVDALEQRIDKLQAAIDNGDLGTLQQLSHQLKGSSRGYGFEVIGRMAGLVEESLKADRPFQEVDQQVQNLIDLCRRARADSSEE
jgi:HPt (histidine-containing phosphotransfer) domain-containing protein